MIVDTSALVAILKNEEEAETFTGLLLFKGDDFTHTDVVPALSR